MEDIVSSNGSLKAKTYILLFLMITLGSVGNAILDKGMKVLGPIDFSTRAAMWRGAFQTFTSGTIWLGIFCMLLFMVCHMLVLSWADYSFVMLFSAITYALVPLLGYIWLGEYVPMARRIGIVLIVFGVFLVSRTPPRTTPSGSSGSISSAS
jgi:multidrug transporter EmrE-like cation transporter